MTIYGFIFENDYKHLSQFFLFNVRIVKFGSSMNSTYLLYIFVIYLCVVVVLIIS